MSDLLQEMTALLKQEEAIYKKLLSLSDSKRQAIVKGDINALDAVVSEEEGLLEQISGLEQKRAGVVEQAAALYQVSADQITLADWPENLAGEENRQLGEQQQKLQALLLELDRQNQINARLIEVHLSYIDYIFDTATQTKESTAYAADGSLDSKKSQSANLFDETM